MTQQPSVELLTPASDVRSPWWRVLLISLLFYALGIVILGLTRNPKLFPVVVLIGSLAVPLAYVSFFYNHRLLSRIAVPRIALCFIYGGVIGVFVASLLEPLFIHKFNLQNAFKVGLIEEFAKILGVLAITLHRRHTSEMNGLILGAAAGMGFATLESAGYSFVTFLESRGDLPTVFSITFVRGVLSPIGHGTWTAILAAVLYRESKPGHFRFDARVLLAYLGVAALHGLWDGLPSVVTILNLPVLSFLVAEAGTGAIGLIVLWGVWKDAKRRMITDNMVFALAASTRKRAA